MPQDDEIREAFVEKMGARAQAEGLPRGAGRIFALLVFDGEPIAFSALAVGLGMSRGGVSMAVQVLEARGLIRRLKKPGDRQDYFETAPDAFPTILAATQERLVLTRQDIDATIAALPETSAPAKARLAQLSAFYDAMSTGLETSLTTLNRTRTPS